MSEYGMTRFDSDTDWCAKAIADGYPFLVAYRSGCYVHGGTDLQVRDDLATCKRIKAPAGTAFVARDNGRPVQWDEFSDGSKANARWKPPIDQGPAEPVEHFEGRAPSLPVFDGLMREVFGR